MCLVSLQVLMHSLTHRENESRCVELSTTAMFMGTPISLALASHACEAAWAALSERVGLHLMVAIFHNVYK